MDSPNAWPYVGGGSVGVPLVRPPADGKTYECSHYERAYDVLHFRFLLSGRDSTDAGL
jgi:hypothetical protein